MPLAWTRVSSFRFETNDLAVEAGVMKRPERHAYIGLLGMIGVIKFTVVLKALEEGWHVALLDNATDIVIILVLVMRC